MQHYGAFCSPVEPYAALWSFMEAYGTLWSPMDVIDHSFRALTHHQKASEGRKGGQGTKFWFTLFKAKFGKRQQITISCMIIPQLSHIASYATLQSEFLQFLLSRFLKFGFAAGSGSQTVASSGS